MGLIVKRLEIFGDKGSSEAEVLFNPGARRSVIRKDVAEKISTLIPLPKTARFYLADGKTEVTTNFVVNVSITIGDRIIFDQFPVLENLSREVIIGANTLQSWEIKLDLKNESVTVIVDSKAIELL